MLQLANANMLTRPERVPLHHVLDLGDSAQGQAGHADLLELSRNFIFVTLIKSNIELHLVYASARENK